jgi:hypothetical protein
MTSNILAAIRPHLSLYGPPEPNPASADPIVARAVAETPKTGVTSAANQPPPDVLTIRITAIAAGPGNARVSRSAIVRIGPALPRGYAVLAWGAHVD